ncbi:25f166f7-2958-4c2e-902e-207f3879a38a-CDS [Sclerotinia trifoliorum]|uniref:25f166f7-2958-4c2e-902e-207f3879a38a-CDS n=1 Tax=Sclerotinia trifoliorum TaxID=28548 RepID=A0A8H2VUM6_9HELO|nr:25f166f7-2958-4c2e-902e-207f3879a38a-CDS [Sclerotinia trifoliorum]
MTTPQRETLPNGLPNIQRLITTTNPNGKAILEPSISPTPIWQPIQNNDMSFFLAYTTHQFPISLSHATSSSQNSTSPTPTDIASYTNDLSNPPGLSISTGTVVRFVDFKPDVSCPMHKTVSLDYGVVVEGVVELVLDSGETRVMHRGDVCVQRATSHLWRNVTEGLGEDDVCFDGGGEGVGFEEVGVEGWMG